MGPEGEGQPPRIGGWHLTLQEGDRELQPLQTLNGSVQDRASRGDNRALATHSQEGRPPHGVPPDQFIAQGDWIPLYTHEGLQKYLPAALSAFPSQGIPSLVAVVLPEFCVGTDKEFLLCNFHHHGCLVGQSFNLKGRHRQLAFCLYCGVINKNSDMALSHVRKYLNLQFVCGGCFSRSFLNGPTLNKHMKACASVTTIRDCSKW